MEKLGRFNHHSDAAIDFCVEVECLEGMLFDATHGTSSFEGLSERIEKAMAFRVGGDLNAISAKTTLRALDSSLRTTLINSITATQEMTVAELIAALQNWPSDLKVIAKVFAYSLLQGDRLAACYAANGVMKPGICCDSVTGRPVAMTHLIPISRPYSGPARDGIEAQHGLNDIYPDDPYPPRPESRLPLKKES